MDRLTEWRGEHAAVVNHHKNYIDRLARYEDLEEQGRLVILPCKAGDTVYFQDDYYGRVIQKAEVKCLRIRADKNKVLFGADVEFYIVDPYYQDGRLMLCGAVVGIDNSFGNQPTAFLTREEAEKALISRLEDTDG